MLISDWSSDVCSSDLSSGSGRSESRRSARSERTLAGAWGRGGGESRESVRRRSRRRTDLTHAALARRPCRVWKGINEGAPVTGCDGGRDGRAALRNWRIAMGSFSIWHWLIVGIVVMLLFGKGRFSDMMGDVAKGKIGRAHVLNSSH